MEGQGRLIFVSGDYYEGEFKENKRNGRGKYVFANGNCYEGKFRNDKFHGKGKMYRAADGSVIKEGVWVDHQF